MLNNLAMVTFDFTKTEVYLCKQSSAVNQSYTKDHQERCTSELTKVKISGSREIALNQIKGREDFDFEKVRRNFLLCSIYLPLYCTGCQHAWSLARSEKFWCLKSHQTIFSRFLVSHLRPLMYRFSACLIISQIWEKQRTIWLRRGALLVSRKTTSNIVEREKTMHRVWIQWMWLIGWNR